MPKVIEMICNVVTKIVVFILNTGIVIINFISSKLIQLYNFLFKYICILDNDIRRDIFIGVTGITIAIVIFIAEVISNKKNELEKKLILSITKIKRNIIFCIFTFLLLYIATLIQNTNVVEKLDGVIYNDFLYFLIQFGINICILIFMYKTVKIFLISVKLNTDKSFLNSELEKFIEKRADIIEKRAFKKGFKNINKLKKEYDDFINSNSRISKDYLALGFSDGLYVPIYPNRNGIVKKYDYHKISSIVNSLEQKSNLEVNEYKKNEEIFIYIIKNIGEKVTKQEPIAYCLKDLYKQCSEISYAIDYCNNVTYIDDEIKVINDELCKIAMTFNEPDDFDSNDMLFNFFNCLYKNNLNGIKSLALEQVYETAKRLYKNEYKNKSLCRFLNRISYLAFENDCYEDYAFINDLIYILYLERLKIKDNDIKQVSFDFVTRYFRFNYYSVSKYQDITYCDNLTSYLFRFISTLIKRRDFESVLVIFDNVTFNNKDINEQDLSELEILNFQFVCGIVFCLYLTYKKYKLNESEIKQIKQIIRWLQYNLFGFYDAWHIICCFKKYFSKSSCIQKAYDDFNHSFEEHKYKSSWSGGYIDNNLILRELLVAFDVSFAFEGDINYDEISKDDLNYYQSIQKIISEANSSCFTEVLNKNYRTEDILKVLNKVIEEAQKKEEEYLKNNKLNSTKVNDFKTNIINAIKENNSLIEYLNEIGKIENKKYKLKIVYGINEIIPRDFFFDDCYDLENVASDLGKKVKRGVTNKYIEKIKGISKKTEKNLNDLLKEIEDIEEYILISDLSHCRKIDNYDYKTDTININDKIIKVFKIPQIESFYLIKKEYLPILEYCDFEDIYSKVNIQESIYYEFKDCSKDEDLRNSIIETNKWLSEKGSVDEQHSYLKKQCRLKVYLSFKVRKVKNSTAIQINYK